jgi:hypothetical protein
MTPVPAPTAAEPVEQRVRRLLGRWRAETAHWSSSSRITGHPAHQELIALGAPALPALFRDLEQSLDGHLSKALVAITGAHPVLPEEQGHMGLIAARWLQWAKEHGYR